MIAGDGLEAVDFQTNPIANQMLQKMFNPKALKKVAFNLKLYGYAPVIVKGGSSVTSVIVSDAQKWRSGSKDEDGRVLEWWYSEDWENSMIKPIPYSTFGYLNDSPEQVFVFQLPTIGLDYYPPVDYNGGTTYIQLEAEIGEFHLSAIQNGLAPSSMINFNNGIPPEKEQQVIENKVKGKFSGSSKAGKFFLSFNDNPENATTINTMEVTRLDRQYEFLSKECTSKIFVAHRVTSPIIFGIRDGSGLGNNAEELQNSYLLYYETVVRPYQEIIFDGVQTVLYKNKIAIDAVWIEYMPFKRDVIQDKAEDNQKTSNLSMADVQLAVDDYTTNNIDAPEGFKLIDKRPFYGNAPKTNGATKVLYKLHQVDANKRNVLLATVTDKDGYYEYDFIKDHPNSRESYWEEHIWVKSKD